MTFGTRLNQARKERGRTAQDMASMLGIGLRSYRAYESGDREPYFDTLVKIADSLDVSTDYLLCRDDFLTRRTVRETSCQRPYDTHAKQDLP